MLYMPARLFSWATFLTLVLHCVRAVAVAGDEALDEDPYIKYRPEFARSLPVQILLTGIVLTLVAVLFIHLLFTARYHWPIAQINFVLQISGVTTLLISLVATLHVVLNASIVESKTWPYMLSYISVSVPPSGLEEDEDGGWSTTEKAMWFLMNATTSGLVQITHIQFLTLLYPSRLEARLVLFLLGPLAVVSAIMQLLPISSSHEVNYYASAIRNVCNATLSLLFTALLFIWGLLVNRKQAWRTDGGTAAFGAAALVLALVSTALNFLYIPREEEYVWLPGLMWAVVLWQSFLGWWWWVGSGSGDGVNGREITRREEKRERRKHERGVRRQETRERARLVWRGVTHALSQNMVGGHSKASGSHATEDPSDDTYPDTSSPPTSPTDPLPPPTRQPRRTTLGTRTNTSSSGYAPSEASTYSLPNFIPASIHRWYADLRFAHREAARAQAAERVARMREIGRESDVVLPPGNGWGLGSFGWRTGPAAGTSANDPRRESSRESVASEEEGGETSTTTSRRKSPSIPSENAIIADPRTPEGDDVQNYPPPPLRQPPSPPLPPPHATTAAGRSMWWWGPLRKWRLQDSTIY